MTAQFQSRLLKQHKTSRARVMAVTTAHGEFLTPTFMPVGTRAFVNHMTPLQLEGTLSQIILGGNTYHMLCAPGLDFIRDQGGMHTMMGWSASMLTDSGGYQVFSLAKGADKCCRIDEAGAHFKHPTTGQVLHLTPKTSIHGQKIIGADIIMAFDECTPEQGGREAAQAALTRTHRWLLEAIDDHAKTPHSEYGTPQALFGIIQGGRFADLRAQSAEFVVSQPLDGIAIGGEVIGYDMAKTCEILDWIYPLLPHDKVRYTMGVGLCPEDLIDVVEAGVDMFDCVAPTRNARHGTLYCGRWQTDAKGVQFIGQEGEAASRLLIKKSRFANDARPVMDDCACETCKRHSRAYLHYLSKTKSPLYYSLACVHNVQVMQKACTLLREWVFAN